MLVATRLTSPFILLKYRIMKKLLTSLLTASLLTLGATAAFAETAPKSVIHVVSVNWKAEATPEQIKAALDGVQALPAANAGITRVWTKAIKVQGKWSAVFVMEFADEAALKAYAGSAAQKEWYKTYMPIRGNSNTHDITN
ncbi:MAG: hypothetical protein B9S28_05975 [Opitutia bacterium Tous-C10FEB]|nr:MAG: hypothetical protein B9S28_05975 [Opitutae bacterium Tous-C10FEB]